MGCGKKSELIGLVREGFINSKGKADKEKK